ncbi:RHS repeat-associated core domain-containing protein [Pseudomonas shirazica]|uniref:RHS repeat-associated core domain-containing protein n=1 Tax=Pseudomonas shirazica TaxID=1940636 RepID=UPI001C25AF3F|nr:RHS repeat-associated core domain-containing protein [Pseudomonas shirazica]
MSLALGFRAYNPRLMRFHSPDSLPPEETGINPYSYALGNPVYWQDPTGHRGQPVTHGREAPLEIISDDKPKIPWYVWLGVAATAAIFVVSAIAMPWTAPATLGITAGYVAGVVGVASNGVAAVLQGVGTAKRIENPELSDALFHISTVFSVIGMYAGGYGSASTRAAVKAVKSAKSVSSSAVNVATKVKVINNPVKIFKFKPRTSVRDVKFTSATQTTAPGSPTTTATPTPTSSPTPTPTSGLVSDGPSTSAALSAENATKAAARTATRAPAPPRIFKLDLTTLDNQAGNILQKTDDGSFISAPPKR